MGLLAVTVDDLRASVRAIMIRKRFFIFLAVGLLLLIGVYLLRTRPASKEELAKAEKQSVARETMTGRGPHQEPVPGDVVPPDSPEPSAVPVNPIAKLSRAEQMTSAIMHLNVPLALYGKVTDQDGAPVSGAKVRLRYREYVLAAPNVPSEKNAPVNLTTDANGSFELSGVKGDAVSIEEISKKGYQLSSKTMLSYGYTKETFSDSSNPIIFRMWKGQGADRLVNRNQHIRIPYDGTPNLFDVMEGKKVTAPPADIRVTLLRTPLERKLGSREKYDWTATIEVLDGGLVEANDEFMYRAPEQGYVPALQVKVLATDAEWTPDKTISFYLKSRGNYGWVTLEFRTDSDMPTTGFSFQSSFNPTGSRNLEFDERQKLSRDNHFPPE